MEHRKLSFILNGKNVSYFIDVKSSLADVLRGDAVCHSVKQGCNVGECGACTVLVDGITVTSCIYLAVWAEGKEVITLEYLAQDGELSAIQKQFIACGAVQCGFCTPGMIMSTLPLLAKEDAPTEDGVRRAIAGNLCRCTGYEQILEAVTNAHGKQMLELPCSKAGASFTPLTLAKPLDESVKPDMTAGVVLPSAINEETEEKVIEPQPIMPEKISEETVEEKEPNKKKGIFDRLADIVKQRTQQTKENSEASEDDMEKSE